MCLYGSPTEFETSMCNEALSFADCKLARVASIPGQCSVSCRVLLLISQPNLILVERASQQQASDMPLPLRLALDNYVHALTLDTRPFPFSLLGGAGPGYEATPTYKAQHPEVGQ